MVVPGFEYFEFVHIGVPNSTFEYDTVLSVTIYRLSTPIATRSSKEHDAERYKTSCTDKVGNKRCSMAYRTRCDLPNSSRRS